MQRGPSVSTSVSLLYIVLPTSLPSLSFNRLSSLSTSLPPMCRSQQTQVPTFDDLHKLFTIPERPQQGPRE